VNIRNVLQRARTVLVLAAVALCATLYLRRGGDAKDFEAERRAYRRETERLQRERDSLYRALHRQETHYRAAADSLGKAFDALQTRQTQNRQQYEDHRRHVIRMSDDGRYRFVADYLSRYADSVR
jgi:uncharacterized protein HemX